MIDESFQKSTRSDTGRQSQELSFDGDVNDARHAA
jgi:hypothetical protein